MDGTNYQLVAKLRKDLRIDSNFFDDEIADLIATAETDLSISGLIAEKITDDTDALIRQAIVLYVKANFGLDNKDSDKYQASYEAIKRRLMGAVEYSIELGV